MKKHLPYDENDDRELFDDSFHAASVSECTGLIPSAPLSESEIRSYSDIYDIPLPTHRNDRRETMNNQNRKNQNQKNQQQKNQQQNQQQENQQNQQQNQRREND